MLDKIQSYIEQHKLFSPKDKLILGVSGGPDSVFLVRVLTSLKYKHLAIAHVDHMIRGISAEKDARFVKALAKKLKLSFFDLQIDTPLYAKENKLSLEEAARQIRLQFFEELSTRLKTNKVVLAHNANDQAETIIMRFLRGSGMQGLVGIEPQKKIGKLNVCRPLLNTWREEIMAYHKENKEAFCIDETNKEEIYLRNRVRLSLIPELQKYNPNLGETMLRMAEVFREEESFMRLETERLLKEVIQNKKKNALRLDPKKLYKQPLAMQRRIIRTAIEQVQGDLDNVSLLYVENFIRNNLTTIRLDDRGILHTSKEKV
ncbi:MAG: tRNA lysidine(34) synthetase TilS [Candidatus Margulisiibacteriota bacterium]